MGLDTINPLIISSSYLKMQNILLYYHLPFLVLAITTGFQIGGYFIYLYIINKKKQLDLNRLLFAYGVLYVFLMTSISIRTTYTYLLTDELLRTVFFELSHIFILAGAALFLFLLSSEVFDEIINNNITRLVLVIALINSVLVSIIQENHYVLMLLFISFGIAALYLFFFHFKLIKLTTGSIKQRIMMITIGNVLVVVGFIFQADEIITILPYEDQIFLMVFSNPIFLIGGLIVFLGLFKFPAFLEFNWKKDLADFYVINNQDLCLLYQYDFNKENPSKIKVGIHKTQIGKVLPKGIIGIDSIFSNLTHTNEKIQIIKQGALNILLSQGEPPYDNITYILVTNSEMNSYHYFLNKLKKTFQEAYGGILKILDVIEEKDYCMFLNFDQEIKNLLR